MLYTFARLNGNHVVVHYGTKFVENPLDTAKCKVCASSCNISLTQQNAICLSEENEFTLLRVLYQTKNREREQHIIMFLVAL